MVLDRERQEKYNFKAHLFESMAHVESLKNVNRHFMTEKLETEALSSKIQSELNPTLSKQNHLLKTIQNLEVEVSETYLDGFLTLYENTQPHPEQKDASVDTNESNGIVQNSTCFIKNKPQSILPYSRFKDRVFHENLVYSRENIIERHYTNKGFGKFYGVFQKHFPDACHIM